MTPRLPECQAGTLLSSIDSPDDLRKLPVESLPTLCGEIRDYLIANLSHNPGHFGSSMGAVEIIVALHYVFNTPRDRVVWDVGHQAYAHKLITGRRDAFCTQRTFSGISGFPFPSESKYDTFVCGHAGNSISAALGMAIADRNSPDNADRKTVAVIGDASIGNGLAFEGLNNASNNPNNLLIILNDNDMSIDDNVGALHQYLSYLNTSAGYNKLRLKVYNKFRKHGLINDRGKGMMMRFSNSLKALISKQQNIFEGLNIRYFGPFDGHDVVKLVKTLNDIKNMTGPRILHLRTKKGKGYEAAEKNPQAWHAPGKFNPDTGEKITSYGNMPWQDVFGHTLVELASKNDNIMGITAAMTSGTSMSMMQEAFPQRTFDVGISEGHAVTFAGGLAAAGKKPYVAIYSSFLQRAVDNIIHDVAIQGLPVVFCIDRAGTVGEDGVTHHGLFDISYLKMIPNMTITAPMDAETLRNLMKTAESAKSPFAIRYPRGKSDVAAADSPMRELMVGKGRKIHSSGGSRVAILSAGPLGKDALEAARELAKENIPVDVYDMIWIKPLDMDIVKAAASYDIVITLEDGILDGGFGDGVLNELNDLDFKGKVVKLGIHDRWIGHGGVEELHHLCGIDRDGIMTAIKRAVDGFSQTKSSEN